MNFYTMSRSYFIVAIALLASLSAGVAGQSCAAGDASCETRDMDVNALLQSAVRVQSMLGTGGDKDDALALGQEKRSCIPLCDKIIVEEGCLFFNAGTDLQGDKYVTNPETLAKFLSTTESVIEGGLKQAGLLTDKVKCMDICHAVVTYISSVTTLPPCTDRACYYKPPTTKHVECDLDVSPERLATIKLTTEDGDMPKTTDTKIMEAGDKTGLGEVSASRARIQRLPSNVSGERRATPHNVTYNTAQIVDRVANTFRIYPVPDMGANDSSFIEIKSSKSTNEESLGSCVDLIGRDHALSKAYVDHVISNIQIDRQRGAASEMQTWFGRTTDATSTEVSRVLAAVDSDLMSIRYSYPGPRCDAGVYGYVYPTAYTGCTVEQIENGHPCTSDFEGKKIVYLCTGPGVYCSVADGEKIETILHEASHHLPAATDDVPPNPYGRYTCKQMAINSPEKSIKNADSFCYYVYDVATKVGTLPPTTGTTTPRPTTVTGPPVSMTVASGNCVLGSTGCVTSTNYPSNYPDREECDITVVTPGKLEALDFATERSFDKLTINGEVFSGTDKGPLDTYLRGNAVQGSIKWVSDGSNPHTGWLLCPEGVTTPTTTPGPTAAPGLPVTWNLKAGSGRGCVKDAAGCMTSDGYPGQYSDYLNCEIEVSVAGELSVEAFNTEQGYDKLTVNGNEFSGDDINAVKRSLEGTTISVQTITWAADQSQTRTGWKLCPKGSTTASTTPTPATTPTVTPAPTTTPTPATTPTVTLAPTTTSTLATTPTTPDWSCPDSNGVIGYRYSHAGWWAGYIPQGPVASDQDCAAKCTETPTCVAFSRHGGDGNCYTYSSTSSPASGEPNKAYTKCVEAPTTPTVPPATTPTVTPAPTTTPTTPAPTTVPTTPEPTTTPTTPEPTTTPTTPEPTTTPTTPAPTTTPTTPAPTTTPTTPEPTTTPTTPAPTTTTPTTPAPTTTPTTPAPTTATTGPPPTVVTVGRVQVQQALQQLAVDQDFLNMMMWKLAGTSSS